MSFAESAKDDDLDRTYRRQLPNDDGSHDPTALELANDWVLRDPSHRTIAKMARDPRTNVCTVVLRGKGDEHVSETQHDFDSALRTALMIAGWSGDK